MPAKNDTKYSPEIEQEITKQYLDGIPMMTLTDKYNVTRRTFYRIIRRCGVSPNKLGPVHSVLGTPNIKPYTEIKDTHIEYALDKPASNRQIRAFQLITGINLFDKCTLTFYEMSDLINTLNIESGFYRGEGYKTRLSVHTYIRNHAEPIIERALELMKHATLIEHENGNRFFTVGEMGAVSYFDYNRKEKRVTRFIYEFDRGYWRTILWLNFRFNWRYRDDLTKMGIPLLAILSQEKSIQNMMYNLLIDYMIEQGVGEDVVKVITILDN